MDYVFARQAEVTGGSPLGRMVTARKVAAACFYLASATSIIGEDLNVTVGVVMY